MYTKDTTTTDQANVVDLVGLPDAAAEAVRSLVEVLREQAAAARNGAFLFPSRQEWSNAVREWANSHRPETTAADWSRGGIYAGRGAAAAGPSA